MSAQLKSSGYSNLCQSVPLSILTYSQSSRLVHVKSEKEQLKSSTPQLQGLSLIGWVGGHTLRRWEVQGYFWDFYCPSPLSSLVSNYIVNPLKKKFWVSEFTYWLALITIWAGPVKKQPVYCSRFSSHPILDLTADVCKELQETLQDSHVIPAHLQLAQNNDSGVRDKKRRIFRSLQNADKKTVYIWTCW